MPIEDLTPEERRAVDDYLSLSREERETFLDMAKFLHRPHRDDASIRNLDALIDLVRKRPALVDIMKRAEWVEHAKRILLMLGGVSGAVVAILVGVTKISDLMK